MVVHAVHVPVESFGKICRTCLLAKETCSIFEVTYNNVSIIEMIEKYTFIKISKENGLPINICESCIGLLCQSYNFFELCIRSNMILEKVLQSSLSEARVSSEELNNVNESSLSAEDSAENIIIKIEFDYDENVSFANNDLDDNPEDEIELTASTEKPFSCNLCLISYDTVQELAAHYATVEHDDTTFSCTLCKTNYDTKKSLYEHINSVHNRNGTSNGCKMRTELSENNHEQYQCYPCKIFLLNLTTVIEHYDQYHKSEPKCIICLKTFKSTHIVKFHLKKHLGGSNSCCDPCRQTFPSPKELHEHFETEEHLNPNKCKVCLKEYKNRYLKQLHMLSHTKEKNHKCNLCGKKFLYYTNLRRHIRQHGGRVYSCAVCQESFATSHNLDLHMSKSSHHGVQEGYICEICGDKIESKQRYSIHLRRHRNKQPLMCRLCHHSCTSQTAFMIHRKTHQVLKCRVCDKRFLLRHNLRKHMLIHKTQDAKFVCTLCGQSFLHRNSLRYHFCTNMGDKPPYKCNVCGKTFNHPTNLKTHQLKHTRHEIFVCRYCDKAFLTEALMKSHMLTHFEERPYKCPECEKRFIELSVMKRHRRKHLDQQQRVEGHTLLPDDRIEVQKCSDNLIVVYQI